MFINTVLIGVHDGTIEELVARWHNRNKKKRAMPIAGQGWPAVLVVFTSEQVWWIESHVYCVYFSSRPFGYCFKDWSGGGIYIYPGQTSSWVLFLMNLAVKLSALGSATPKQAENLVCYSFMVISLSESIYVSVTTITTSLDMAASPVKTGIVRRQVPSQHSRQSLYGLQVTALRKHACDF
jgi:hypothetical protein